MEHMITTGPVEIRAVDVRCDDAQRLLDELSAKLITITGHSAASGFAAEDVLQPRSTFFVAYVHGQAVGCAGLRPMNENTAEIKRVFAYPNKIGIGSQLMAAIEQQAAVFGYDEVWLETRRTNPRAVNFYLKLGYTVGDQYGKYVGRVNALCFYKRILH